MEQRKEKILYTIIKEHIKTGAPVGSSILVEKYKLNVSPATVRNDMSDLENDGFIAQPHTSAGRVPTESAYRLYVQNIEDKKIGDKEASLLLEALGAMTEQDFKHTAKVLAALSGNAVFWAFHRHNLYYTGISNLLSQPEFSQTNLIYDISVVIDRVDEIINEIYDGLEDGTVIKLGMDNPFGNFCSTIFAKYKLEGHTGLVGILGPMRMNYEKNLALMKFINSQINNK